MKKILIFMGLISVILGKDYKFGIGYYQSESIYKYAKDIKDPVINLNYKNIELQGAELYYKVVKSQDFNIGPFIEYDISKGFKNGDLGSELSVLEEKGHPELGGIKGNYTVNNINFQIRAYKDFNSSGTGMEFGLSYFYKIYEFLYLVPAAKLIYNNSSYSNKYFGLSHQDAYNLGTEYKEIGKTLNQKFDLGLALFFSESMGMFFNYGIEILDNKSDKRIIKDSISSNFNANVFYMF